MDDGHEKDDVVSMYPEYENLGLVNLIRAMNMVEKERDEIDARLTALNKRYDFLRMKAIPDAFEDSDMKPPLVVAGVGRVSLTTDAFVRILPDKKNIAMEWFQDTGRGASIVPTINPSTLKATIKAALKAGEELPENVFGIEPFTRASITRKGVEA